MNIPAEVNRAQFVKLTGYSPKQVTRFIQETDIPHRRDGSEVLFPWPGARAWLHKYLEEKGKRAAKPESRDDARERKEYAEAEMAELELATMRGELTKTADAEQWFADACGRVRAKLQNLAPRVAAAAYGAQTVAEAQAQILPVIEEVFAELRKTDDVPDDEPGPEVPEDADA